MNRNYYLVKESYVYLGEVEVDLSGNAVFLFVLSCQSHDAMQVLLTGILVSSYSR